MKVADAYQHKFPARTHQVAYVEYDPDPGACQPAELPPAKQVQYQCLQCNVGWLGNVGPTECPQCGCCYVWLHR